MEWTMREAMGVAEDVRAGRRRAEGAAASGSALIAVLWVIVLLSLLVSSFTFDAHIEARIASYCRKRSKAAALARSGIEVARMLMIKREEAKGRKSTDAEDEKDRWHRVTKNLADGGTVRGIVEKLGEGTITLDIVPEPARRNVNRLKVEDWERILEVGGVPEDRWPQLIDSFFDWTDKDDTPRIDGAETEEYYAALTPPYKAKNGPLDTVGELLLVKGFERAILYGGALKSESNAEEPIQVSGIQDLLTTYGDGRVNVNAAPMRVLMTLPDVDETVAGAIVEERQGLVGDQGDREPQPFQNVNDLFGRIPGLGAAVRDAVTTDSEVFRITSVGEVHGVKREVWCIAKYAAKKLTVLRWREQD